MVIITGCIATNQRDLKRQLASEEVDNSNGLITLKLNCTDLLEENNIQINDMFVVIQYNGNEPGIMVKILNDKNKVQVYYIKTECYKELATAIIETSDTISVNEQFLNDNFTETYPNSEEMPERVEIPINEFLNKVKYELKGDSIIIK